MPDETSFLLAHISDLHFSEGTDRSNRNHAHSIEHLLGLQQSIAALEDLDLLVASGDISNHGDRQSLIMASGWLLGSIPIGGGENTGLDLPKERVGIVPGNHDAWNASSVGPLLDRRQKSLANYNFAFPSHAIPDSGCHFRWIEKNGSGLYIAFVDSCFLGDTEQNTESPFGTLRGFEAVAKGKLTVDQTEQLLEWHDCGMHGLLEDPTHRGCFINKEKFATSLKILVMHHYLFEPPEKKSDYFMKIQHRDIVFRNIALSDFDVLLCGHKHIQAFDVHDYGAHFDRRALHRYMLNYFRRLIGLQSLPIQIEDERGKRSSKSVTQLIEIVSTSLKNVFRKRENSDKKIDDAELADQVFNLLKRGLASPDDLRRNVEGYLQTMRVSGASTLEPDELKHIQKRISTGLLPHERQALKKLADRISNLSKRLKSRAFVQLMSGSSAKMPSTAESRRSFQTYKIIKSSDGWKLQSQKYEWNGSVFSPDSALRTHDFPSRI